MRYEIKVRPSVRPAAVILTRIGRAGLGQPWIINGFPTAGIAVRTARLGTAGVVRAKFRTQIWRQIYILYSIAANQSPSHHGSYWPLERLGPAERLGRRWSSS